jgi:hypothetical protein
VLKKEIKVKKEVKKNLIVKKKECGDAEYAKGLPCMIAAKKGKNGACAAKFGFKAITGKGEFPVCGPGTSCWGWKLWGAYALKTKANGETVLNVDARVKRPKKFNLNSMFGVGWGIGYGPRLSKSESFVAMWSY